MSGRVVVIGSANADLIVQVERRPTAGETLMGGDLVTLPGGKGANQAVAAGRLGAHVAFVGRVGADGHGEMLRASLTAAGVDTSHLLATPGKPTGVALITIDADGDNAIIVAPGANSSLDEGAIAAATELLATAAVIVLQMEIPLTTVAAAVLGAPATARVVLNVAPPAPVAPEVLRRCDPVVVNEHEASALLGGRTLTPEQAVLNLLASGARSVVLTHGADGAYVSQGSAVVHVSAPRVTPVDTTGAGDAFVGALAWRLAEGDDLVTAARFAARVGSTAVLGLGAQPSYPRLDQVIAES